MLPQHKIKIFLLICLLFLNSSIPGGADNYFKGSTEIEKLTNTPYHEVMLINVMKGRKLMTKVDAMLDYYDPKPNPVHDPRKGN